jgi:hypothetical protein
LKNLPAAGGYYNPSALIMLFRQVTSCNKLYRSNLEKNLNLRAKKPIIHLSDFSGVRASFLPGSQQKEDEDDTGKNNGIWGSPHPFRALAQPSYS